MSLDTAIGLLHRGKLAEGIAILESLYIDTPDDYDVVHNLGLARSEAGDLAGAIELLSHAAALKPDEPAPHSALAVAYARLNQLDDALHHIDLAIAIDPNNANTLQNRGAILSKVGRYEEAVSTLLSIGAAGDMIPEVQYGLGELYERMDDTKNAQIRYQKVLTIPGNAPVREFAREALSRIASTTLHTRADGNLRMDAVLYMGAALDKFEKMDPEDVKILVYDIASTGLKGFDINDPSKTYTVKSMPGSFTGLQLVSYMYAGLKMIGLEKNAGIDLSQEFHVAQELRGGGKSPITEKF